MRRATKADKAYLNFLLSESIDKCKDDGTPEELRYLGGNIVDAENVWTIIPVEGVVCIARPLNSSTYESHVAVDPKSGINAIKAVRAAIKWFFEKNQLAIKLVAFVPEHRRDVKLFCTACGYKIEGVLTKSFIKNGQAIDQTV